MLTAVEDRSGLPWWWSGSFNRKKSEKNQNDSSVLPKIPGAAGPVKVKWMAGHMKVKLVAGHMKVKLTADHLKVKLTAGHMQVKLIAGHVKVKLMAGHMKVNVKVNYDISALSSKTLFPAWLLTQRQPCWWQWVVWLVWIKSSRHGIDTCVFNLKCIHGHSQILLLKLSFSLWIAVPQPSGIRQS